MNTLKRTLDFIRAASMAATINGHGSKADFLADRIVQASTCDTILAMGERLCKLMGSDAGCFAAVVVSDFMLATSAQDAKAVLSWLRKYPKVAAMVCFLPGPEYNTTVDGLPDVTETEADDIAPVPRGYMIPISIELTAPLAHGSDTKAGNATLFRRQDVMGKSGGMMRLPFYSGNAVRGRIRDLLADDLLKRLGLQPSRSTPPVALWFFHALYAGGALEENSPATKAIAKRTGGNGAIRAEGMREFRDLLPSLSALGCAVGNKIISGRAQFGDLRPRCKEWGTGEAKAESLFDWLYLTRRDDHEGRAEGDNKSMIANTEVLKPGVILDGGVDVSGHASALEAAAIQHGVELFRIDGYLGADNRRGFGKFVPAVIDTSTIDGSVWCRFVAENKEAIIAYLTSIDALAKAETF
jgi:hypothetical protein